MISSSRRGQGLLLAALTALACAAGIAAARARGGDEAPAVSANATDVLEQALPAVVLVLAQRP
ncbi:MAG TPA: hypothetical protein VE782_12180, partial [Myxococcaceae bacterium]|nr:hypothetical protein [Myxococcaceae bacterium]